MSNIDKAFTVEEGISLNDTVLITTAATPPSSGYEAPHGSIVLYADHGSSTIYVKTGTHDTDWRPTLLLTQQAPNHVLAAPRNAPGIPSFRTINLGDLGDVDLSTVVPINGQVLSFDGTKWIPSPGGGSGTVTSVALAAPSYYSVSGSPVTTNGTLTLTLNSQNAKHVLAAPSGSSGVPTFRQLTLSDNSDVDFSVSPQSGNILKYNGSHWAPSQSTAGSYTTVISTWLAVGDGTYYADVTHNLNTRNITVSLYDNATNSLLLVDKVTLTTTNVIRLIAAVNTYEVRCVIIADGQTVSPSAGTIIVKDEGTNVAGTPHSSINFVGTGVTVMDVGGVATVTIPGGGSIKTNTITSSMFDSPNNVDWVVNSLAAAVVDPTNNALTTRQFSNTTEQGVGFILQIPSAATTMVMKFRGRAATTPGVASVVQPRLYRRILPNNSAVGAWSSAFELGNISIPTNTFYQYSSQTVALSTLGITPGNTYQFELTRRVVGVTGGTNLASNWLMVELSIEFI